MIDSKLSPNTQATLLLTAPLIGGGKRENVELVKPKEYRELARLLEGKGAAPSDLLQPGTHQLIAVCAPVVAEARLDRLLSRGFRLAQTLEQWSSRAVWVIGRSDDAYPQRLRDRLGEASPLVLYGCGDHELLGSGGLAVVGSRRVDAELLEYTESIGQLAAQAGRTLVSGGARGVDQAAMRGALEAGGCATGALADSLLRAATKSDNRKLLVDGQLVLVSPYDPSARFNVGHAMQRNKVIYALADAGLAVNTDLEKGGTWSGAKEQLEKLHFVPVYVRSTGPSSPGLDGLKDLGALPWPEPETAEELAQILSSKRTGLGPGSSNESADGGAPNDSSPRSDSAQKPEKTVAVQTSLFED